MILFPLNLDENSRAFLSSGVGESSVTNIALETVLESPPAHLPSASSGETISLCPWHCQTFIAMQISPCVSQSDSVRKDKSSHHENLLWA